MFTEDLSLFFDTTNGFAVDVTIKSGATTVRTIKGIFDAGLDNAALLGTDIEVPNPSLVCRTSDLDASPAVTHANTFVIASVTYRFMNRQDDGTGISTVTLQK
jgi:hypothetical protein